MNLPDGRPHVVRILLISAAALTCAFPCPAQDGANVVVTEVEERDINAGHRVVGSVMPIQTSTVGSAVDGRLVEFLVDAGDAVKQGQPLARLRTGTLKIELAIATAELDLRQQELAELENGSRAEEIAAAKARTLAAKAVQLNTGKQLERAESLFERNVISASDVDDARERSEAARQQFLAADSALKLLEAGPRPERIAQARARLNLQQEQVRLLEDKLAKYEITAPFDGFIAAEHTAVGAWISQGDPIADVIQLKQVEVTSRVPAEHAVRLSAGQSVRLEFPELPGELLTGTIRRVVPLAESRTRTFPVHVLLDNRMTDGEPLLMAGMLARVHLPTGARTRLPLVPKDALVLQGSRRSVFVIQPTSEGEGTVRQLAVELGVANGTLIQVRADDIRAGQLVVVRGNERLTDGQLVRYSRQTAEPKNGENR